MILLQTLTENDLGEGGGIDWKAKYHSKASQYRQLQRRFVELEVQKKELEEYHTERLNSKLTQAYFDNMKLKSTIKQHHQKQQQKGGNQESEVCSIM